MAQERKQQFPARHELKYYINRAELAALRARLTPLMRLDTHCLGGKPYLIRSLYFDDAYNTAYREKLDGIMQRDKYRIRIYNHSDAVIFLERKRKQGDLIQKSSVRITRRLCEQLMAGDPTGLQTAPDALLQDMYVQMRTMLLRPVVLVDYLREAYVHPVENTRVTFDTQLRSGLFSNRLFEADLPMISPLDEDLEILEVKFDQNLPAHVAGLLAGISATRSAISKYVLCRRYEPLGGDPV